MSGGGRPGVRDRCRCSSSRTGPRYCARPVVDPRVTARSRSEPWRHPHPPAVCRPIIRRRGRRGTRSRRTARTGPPPPRSPSPVRSPRRCGRRRRSASRRSGRDGGEGDGPGAQLVGDPQRLAVAGRQQLRAVLVAVVRRADGVDDPARVETARGGGDRLSGEALAVPGTQLAAGREDRGASAAVDGAVDSAAAEERGVRRVDDRVHCCSVMSPRTHSMSTKVLYPRGSPPTSSARR